MTTLKDIKLETIVKVVIVAFIAFCLISVTIAAFSDLTLLNRSF